MCYVLWNRDWNIYYKLNLNYLIFNHHNCRKKRTIYFPRQNVEIYHFDENRRVYFCSITTTTTTTTTTIKRNYFNDARKKTKNDSKHLEKISNFYLLFICDFCLLQLQLLIFVSFFFVHWEIVHIYILFYFYFLFFIERKQISSPLKISRTQLFFIFYIHLYLKNNNGK